MLETKLTEVFRAKALTVSGNTPFSAEFKMGEAWTALRLYVNLIYTQSAGSAAVSEGELQILNAINFKTDRGEVIYKNCPARWIFRMDQLQSKTLPQKDAFACTTATYRVPVTLWFIDPTLNDADAYRSVLDTSRYNSVELTMGLGGLSSLCTPSGDTLTVTMDAYIESLNGGLAAAGLPGPDLYRRIGVMPPQLASSQLYIDIDKSPDLFYKRWAAISTSGGTAGSPLTGTLSDGIINDLNLETNLKYIQFNVLNYALERKNKTDYQNETQIVGQHMISVVEPSRSLKTVWAAKGESLLRLNYTAQGGLPGTPMVTACYDAVSHVR